MTRPTPSCGPRAARPDGPGARGRLVPEAAEQLTFHVHAHLDVFVDGQKVTVPAGIGIDTVNPAVHEFPEHRRRDRLRRHQSSVRDRVHLATPHPRGDRHPPHRVADRKNNTLGQLFTEWDVKLDQNCVNTYCRPQTKIAIYVNGKPFTGDPRTIPLSNFKEIAIVIGTPPAQIPAYADLSQI